MPYRGLSQDRFLPPWSPGCAGHLLGWPQKLQYSPLGSIYVLRFAFPDNQRLPSKRAQGTPHRAISLTVPRKLRQPVPPIRPGKPCDLASSVLMPKAPVNKDDLVSRGEHQIWLSWETSLVQPEPIPQAVNKRADRQLGRHALASYSAHVLAAPLWRQAVQRSTASLPTESFTYQPFKAAKVHKCVVLLQSLADKLRREVHCCRNCRIGQYGFAIG